VKILAQKLDRLPALAQDLIRLNVDVIVTFGPVTIRPAREATRTIPIVMIAGSGDPVRDGLVASLAHPGGNITGVTWSAGPEVIGKNLEILKQVVPRLSRVALLSDGGQSSPSGARAWEDATRQLGLRLERVVINDPTELESTMAAISRQRVDAVYVTMAGVTFTSRNHVAALAVAGRLPTFGLFRELAEAGGLLSYGPSIGAIYRRGAYYVDKILRGAKPADLPIEQPTKFELVINLKTAKALGLTIPQSLLIRADEIMQ
jgi:putative ABC transport system substrate-binding protein